MVIGSSTIGKKDLPPRSLPKKIGWKMSVPKDIFALFGPKRLAGFACTREKSQMGKQFPLATLLIISGV